MRRNHKMPFRRSAGPFNELYKAFEPYFSDIMTSRFFGAARTKTYVSVPEVEDQIVDYISYAQKNERDNKVPVLVVHGLTGVGKSSIVYNLAQRYSATEDYFSIYLEFAGRHHGLTFSENYFEKPVEQRIAIARDRVASRFNGLIRSQIDILMDEYKVEQNLQFFDHLADFYTPFLHPTYKYAKDEESKYRIITKFLELEDDTAIVHALLTYACAEVDVDTVVVWVDNIDEQPKEVVDAFFWALDDFLACCLRPVEAVKLQGANPLKHRQAPRKIGAAAIMSCRTQTWRGLATDSGGILQTRGHVSVEVSAGVILAKILERRIETSSVALDSLSYQASTGLRITGRDVEEFLKKFTAGFAESISESIIFDLCNRSYARAFDNMAYILKNSVFINYDAAMLHSALDQKFKPDLDISRVIKALSYGNVVDESQIVYPTASTIVQNIMEWNPVLPRTFLSVLRMLMFLRESENVGKSVAYFRQGCSRILGIDGEAFNWSIEKMNSEALIFTESGHMSTTSEEEAIEVSAKGNALLRMLLEYNSNLFEIYLDDIDNPPGRSDLLGHRPPVPHSSRYPKRENFLDTLAWLKAIGDYEFQLLEEIDRFEPGLVESCLRYFDDRLICQRIADVVRKSMSAMYRGTLREEDRESFEKMVISFDQRVDHLRSM